MNQYLRGRVATDDLCHTLLRNQERKRLKTDYWCGKMGCFCFCFFHNGYSWQSIIAMAFLRCSKKSNYKRTIAGGKCGTKWGFDCLFLNGRYSASCHADVNNLVLWYSKYWSITQAWESHQVIMSLCQNVYQCTASFTDKASVWKKNVRGNKHYDEWYSWFIFWGKKVITFSRLCTNIWWVLLLVAPKSWKGENCWRDTIESCDR